MAKTHLIGMLLGVEEDWPAAFEALLGRADLTIREGGETHRFTTERVTIEPFDLRMRPRHSLVIDRLGWWYPMPREWLKKVALMDRVHLLNNPFTFQAMEKHAAYCAMIRLGLKVPETWMLPNKVPPNNPRFAGTAQRYLRYFDLEAVAHAVGMPLYMKPFDGGAWVGVSRIEDTATLHRAYDESDQRLMHLQAAVDGFDVFARSLGIGAEAMVLHFHPDRPMHERYSVDHEFLQPDAGDEVVSILRTVNAFFRWELNSCENSRPRRRCVSHRLRERDAGPRAHEPALLLPLGDPHPAQVGGVLLRHRPAANRRPRHGGVLRGRGSRGPQLHRETGRISRHRRPAARGRPVS